MGGLTIEQSGWAFAGAGALIGGLVLFVASARAKGWAAASVWLVRGLLVGLVLAAVGRPAWTRPAGRGRLVVLADRSASMPPAWSGQVLRQLSQRISNTDLAVYAFAGQAQRLVFPSDSREEGRGEGGTWADLDRLLSPADPADGSNPAAAIRMAMGQLGGWSAAGGPSPSRVPLLLLTDGDWTAEDGTANWPGGVWAFCPPRGRANAGLIDLAVALTEEGPTQAEYPGPGEGAGLGQGAGPGEGAGLGQGAGPGDRPARHPAGRLAVRATATGTRDGPAAAQLFVLDPASGPDWQLVGQASLDLSAGQARSVDWTIPAGSDPGRQVRATLAANWDELPGDNQLTALAPLLPGARRLLLITSEPNGPTRQTLDSAPGWNLVVSSPGGSPITEIAAAGRRVDAVVLDDIGPEELSGEFLRHLGDYLRGGGGLLVVGGGNALAAGHYYDSPLEALLAVRTRVRDRPAAAIVLLLDRSGSMNEPPGAPAAAAGNTAEGGLAASDKAMDSGPAAISVSKLELVKQAVLTLPDLFGPADRLAVIGFADQARTVYESRADSPVDWRAVRAALLEMTAGGGTAIGPALRASADWLARQDLPRKHLLLLTDGQFSDMTVEQAADVLGQAGGKLTVSTFAAGRGAGAGPAGSAGPGGSAGPRGSAGPEDRPARTPGREPARPRAGQAERGFLSDLARRFGGAHYPPGDWGRLPARFREDLAGAMLEPTLAGRIEVRADGGRPPMPAIGRMLTCQLGPLGQAWYSGRLNGADRSWPLVAVGPVGAGRSAVVATSLKSGWAGSWTEANQAADLFARLLADIAPGDDPRFALQVSAADEAFDRRRDQLLLDLWVRQPATSPSGTGQPVDLLNLSARLLDAGGRSDQPLAQVGPGHYAATVAAPGPRRLLIIERSADGRERVVLNRSIGPLLAAEFIHLVPQPAWLDRLCRRRGGRLLGSLDEVRDLQAAPRSERHGLWPWLLLAAVGVWVIEIAVFRPGVKFRSA